MVPARHIATLTVLLSILLSAQGGLLVHTLFQLRQDHIAQHHCENRFDPDSECNGVCFLKKRMAEADHNGQEQHGTIAFSRVLYFLPATVTTKLRCPEKRFVYDASYDERCALSGHGREIYRPPRLS